MANAIQIQVFEQRDLAFESPEIEGSVELGRQKPGEPGPFSLIEVNSRDRRLIVARLEEATVSRRHMLVEPMPSGRVRLTNLRDMNVRVPGNTEIKPGTAFEYALPCDIPLGKRLIRIAPVESEDTPLFSLAEPARLLGRQDNSTIVPLPTFKVSADGAVDKEKVFQWLRMAMDVLQCDYHAADFYQKAARAAIDMVGLDVCRLLLRQHETWNVQATAVSKGQDENPSWRPSRRVLDHVREQRKTYWQAPGQAGAESTVAASLMDVQAVVAAPILNDRGDVIGALYGERRHGRGASAVPDVVPLDAMMMDLVATSIGSGMARMESEKAAAAERVRFEQFFTPELSRQLAGRPELLDGQEVDVSILICDIRGSSRITTRLGPARTIEWIRDVMSHISDCVLDHGGVLVDFTGDGLLAMWGAPDKQPDHAPRACRAALAMLETLPALDERWISFAQERMGFGIGISTGPAQVGNIGSHRKFKYGPLGNTVNLASRVEGATKYLKANILITGSTQSRLDDSFRSRRLSRVRMLHIAEPVDLHELVATTTAEWQRLREEYERALSAFENKDLRGAARILGALQIDYPNDGPSLNLLSRTVHFLAEETAEFDAVYTLPGK